MVQSVVVYLWADRRICRGYNERREGSEEQPYSSLIIYGSNSHT